MNPGYCCSTIVLLMLAAGSVGGAPTDHMDWPQFLGPSRNGTADGTALASRWSNSGPTRLWQKSVGQGFSGPVVSKGKVVVFHRLADQETVQCLAAIDGTELWKGAYASTYKDDFGFDEGPRATPSIDEGRVYTFGAEGVLTCWDLSDGKKLWSVDTKDRFHQRKGFFGIACSPVVEGDALILNVGGKNNAGIVAFEKRSGRILWQATSDEASYASPVAGTIDGERRLFVITREAFLGLRPSDGSILFRYPWRPSMEASVSAASPLLIGNQMFISASYGVGASLLRFRENTPEVVWSSDEVLSNHYATSVHHNGFLFGFDGRQEQGCVLRCVELKTGKIQWSESGLKAGTVLITDGQLLVLTEAGELLLAPATPSKFTPALRAQILPFGVRAHPALAGGVLYARSKDKLAAVDLRKPSER